MNQSILEVGSATQNLTGKYLTFTLHRESYGIEVLKIREIVRLSHITTIPRMPAFVSGVINLRGKIVPVVDMRVRLGLASSTATERTCIVVVCVKPASGAPLHFGLVVDGVEEVVNLTEADIEATPEFGSAINTEFLLGIARLKEKVVALLDIGRVFNHGIPV